MPMSLGDAVARFGADVRSKLRDPSAVGEPEDQLRGPLENLIGDINALIGLGAHGVNVTYEVSGKNVIRQWWSYRRKDRSKPPMGDRREPSKLSEIQPKVWLAEYTTELLALLRVLTRLVALKQLQADLLIRIVGGSTIDSDTLRAAGSLGEASANSTEATDDETA